MFSLRSSKSERCLRKLNKSKHTLSWSPVLQPSPEIDFVAFHNSLPPSPFPSPISLPARRPRRISTRNARRDTILIDLTNNDLLPALDYAFAILDDADRISVASSSSTLTPETPLSSGSPVISTCSPPASIHSAPPRYHHPFGPSDRPQSPTPAMTRRGTADSDHINKYNPSSVDPLELSDALSHVQYHHAPPSFSHGLPFPPSPPRSPQRVPLLQRKPRIMHSAESSIDSHDAFMFTPGSSKISLVRSVSSLDTRPQDRFFYSGACRSSASVNTMDSSLSNLLPPPKLSRSSSSSLKLFSPRKFRNSHLRRASTPPHSIPSSRNPPLQELFSGREALSACR